MMRYRTLVVALATLFAVCPCAFAYEDQYTLEGELGYAYDPDHGAAHNGGIVGISGSRGINDVWSARVLLAAAYHPGTHRMTAGIVAAELIYILDVLDVVPFLGVGVNGLLTSRKKDNAHFEIGAHGVIGLDYLLSRSWLIGLDVRGYFPSFYVTSGFRVGYIFDL